MANYSHIQYAPLNAEESERSGAEPVVLAAREDARDAVAVNQEAVAQSTSVDIPPPPCYGDTEEIPLDDDVPNEKPPDYDIASKLPTYEEAEETAALGEATSGQPPASSNTFPFRYSAFFSSNGDGLEEMNLPNGGTIELGNDIIFFSTFLISFLFNWIGFLVAHCFSQTIAGRFGALAGFGLSMVKWTVIMKHSFDLESVTTDWLWWVILLLGVMMFFRGTVQYIRIKQQWSTLTSEARIRYGRFF